MRAREREGGRESGEEERDREWGRREGRGERGLNESKDEYKSFKDYQ